MEQNDLSGVKVGDKLYHVRYGWCEVVDVNRGTHHPIYIVLANLFTSVINTGRPKMSKRVVWIFEVKHKRSAWGIFKTFCSYKEGIKEVRSWKRIEDCPYQFRLTKYVPEVEK